MHYVATCCISVLHCSRTWIGGKSAGSKSPRRISSKVSITLRPHPEKRGRIFECWNRICIIFIWFVMRWCHFHLYCIQIKLAHNSWMQYKKMNIGPTFQLLTLEGDMCIKSSPLTVDLAGAEALCAGLLLEPELWSCCCCEFCDAGEFCRWAFLPFAFFLAAIAKGHKIWYGWIYERSRDDDRMQQLSAGSATVAQDGLPRAMVSWLRQSYWSNESRSQEIIDWWKYNDVVSGEKWTAINRSGRCYWHERRNKYGLSW